MTTAIRSTSGGLLNWLIGSPSSTNDTDATGQHHNHGVARSVATQRESVSGTGKRAGSTVARRRGAVGPRSRALMALESMRSNLG